MTLRRAFGALVWAFMLHLNLVASDLACERHHEGARAVTPIATEMSHASHSAVHNGESGDDHSCKTPVRSDCCRLMASCSVTLGLGASRGDESVSADVATIARGALEQPPALARPPEPPPPKA